ncbi:AI-2E family transporter [Novosphingobium aquae]|uniref:AI-2E family transporter n=1 Tax=Novosphingobium aquae TaxID=3133435 RepID=A0ABU8SAL1_9SPHN
MSETDPVHPTKARAAGPTDFTDPQLRWEMKRAAVWLGLAGLIVLTVFLAQPLLVIFGGLVFAAMIDGGARLLGRVLPLSRGWRVSIVILLAASFLIWTLTFAGTQLANQAAQLPALVESQANRVLDWLRSHGVRIDFAAVQAVTKEVVGGVGQVTHAVGGLIGGATTLFLILVLGIYISAEPRLYQRGVAWMFPISERGHFHATAAQMGKSLRRLMAGRMLGMALEGVLCWIALSIYGVPMAALLGLLTGILAFIPNIGAPISGLIMVMVGFSVDTSTGLYCIIVYFVLHTVDGNLVAPYIARKTVDLAPALVLGAQLIMGTLFGILGLALADPLVAMIKIALERHSARHEAEWHAAYPDGEDDDEEEGATA